MNYNFDNLIIKNSTNNQHFDNIYKISLGCHSYYINNIQKFIDSKKLLKKKKKIYNIINPFYFTIDNYDDNINIIDIKTKFNQKYNKIFNKQEYFKIFEVIKELNINKNHKMLCFDDKTPEVCSLLNIQCDKYNDNTNKLYDVLFVNISLKLTISQEQSLSIYLLNIIKNIKYLKKDGTLVIKLYNILTYQTLSLINNLFSVFEKKSCFVPFMCELYNNEKYLICKNYKTTTHNITNLNLKLSKKIKELFTVMNIELLVKQTIYINIIVDYINKQNYFGSDYNNYLNIQKEKTQFWIDKYLT